MSNGWNLRLQVVGVNHRQARVEIRERLCCPAEKLPSRLHAIIQGNKNIMEAVILSTCNRTEIYTLSSNDASVAEYVTKMMSDWSGIPVAKLKQHSNLLLGEEAVRHLIAVTSGLDSLVVGEQQIQDQVKEASKVAGQAGTSGRFLSELFKYAYRAATNIRKETNVGLERPSVGSAAVSLLKRVSSDHPISSILLVGAGRMISLATEDLAAFSKTEVWVGNRTIQRARKLAERVGGKPLQLEQIQTALQRVDAVLICTSSTGYLIKVEDMEAAMPNRGDRPIILIDASVPRNIDPDVAKIPGIQLYDIDDLAPFVGENQEPYRSKIVKAEELVRVEAKTFHARIRSYDANDTLKDLRRLAEEIREKELSRAMRRLGDISDREKEIVDILTCRIINKLLYEPSARLREHASNGDGEAYEAVIRDLFAIGQETRD
jgi:glutamyl-tRNA reductase